MASKAPWKPPMWLIALDFVAIALLFLGLSMHYAPGGGVAQAIPATLKLPFLIFGGALMTLVSVTALRLVLAHRRS